MDAKAPLPSLADQEPKWGSASNFARDWGLNQLADRLDGWHDVGVWSVANGWFEDIAERLKIWARSRQQDRSRRFACCGASLASETTISRRKLSSSCDNPWSCRRRSSPKSLGPTISPGDLLILTPSSTPPMSGLMSGSIIATGFASISDTKGPRNPDSAGN
jgi:hypothetical protein